MLKDNLFPDFYPEDIGKKSLYDILQQWLCYQKPQIKYASYVKYANLISWYIVPFLGSYEITEITSLAIMEYETVLRTKAGRKGEGLSEKTILDTVTILKDAFEYASIMYGSNFSMVSFPPLKVRKGRTRVFSAEEISLIRNYLCSHPSLKNNGILLALYTGIRVGELCALKWENIDTENEIMKIDATMQRIQTHKTSGSKTEVIITSPKSISSIREIPIPRDIIAILLQTTGSAECYILTGKEDYCEPRVIQKHFSKILNLLEISDASFHTLRHTFATKCVESGFDAKTLSEILGHSNISTTLNRYVHPSLENKRKNMELVHLE